MKFKDLYNRIIDSTMIYVADESDNDSEEYEEVYEGKAYDMPKKLLEKYGDHEIADLSAGVKNGVGEIEIWIVRG